VGGKGFCCTNFWGHFIEQNANFWAEHYNNLVKPGHGLFIDLKRTSKFEKHYIDYLVNDYGWDLEKSYIIRKPTN